MKKAAILVLIIYGLKSSVFGFTLNDSLTISGIKIDYTSHDTIKFVVSKHSSNTIVFSVGLQEKSIGRWVNVVDDIWWDNNGRLVNAFMLRDTVYKIPVSWTPKQRTVLTKGLKVPLRGSYRFLVKWHEPNEPHYNSSYSGSFKLR